MTKQHSKSKSEQPNELEDLVKLLNKHGIYPGDIFYGGALDEEPITTLVQALAQYCQKREIEARLKEQKYYLSKGWFADEVISDPHYLKQRHKDLTAQLSTKKDV